MGPQGLDLLPPSPPLTRFPSHDWITILAFSDLVSSRFLLFLFFFLVGLHKHNPLSPQSLIWAKRKRSHSCTPYHLVVTLAHTPTYSHNQTHTVTVTHITTHSLTRTTTHRYRHTHNQTQSQSHTQPTTHSHIFTHNHTLAHSHTQPHDI